MMKTVTVKDLALRQAAGEGMDAFVACFVTAIKDAIDGELTAETMAQLNADQITLLAWQTLHDEVMDGGFVQLIHNGYGPFEFDDLDDLFVEEEEAWTEQIARYIDNNIEKFALITQ